MTADEWNTTDDVMQMISTGGHKVSQRRLQLFKLACCESENPPSEMRSMPEVIRVIAGHLDGGPLGLARLDAEVLASEEIQRWKDRHPHYQWALAAMLLVRVDSDFMLAWHVVLFLRRATSPTEVSVA